MHHEPHASLTSATQGFGLATRLLFLGLVPSLIVALIIGIVLHQRINDSLYRGFEYRLQEHADRIAANIAVGPEGLLVRQAIRYNDAYAQIFSGWYWQIAQSDPPFHSRSLWDATALSATPLARQPGMLRSSDPRGIALLGVARKFELNGTLYELQVFGPAAEISQDIAHIEHLLMVMFSVLIACLLALPFLQVRLGLRPLRKLRATLSELLRTDTEQPGRQRTQLGTGYGPDLDPLAIEIDALLLRNSRVVNHARGHAADLSHALKTPLARLQAEAGRAPQMHSHIVQEQVRSMNGLIERHMARTLAPATEIAPSNTLQISVHDCLQALVALMQQIYLPSPIQWQVECPSSLHWRGELSDLEEMLGNLMDNAGKWAQHAVRITAWTETASPSQRWLCIAIEDDGEGMTPEQLALAGQRGKRFDEGTPGSGLGLSISHEIAVTYGGDLLLARSEQLGGLKAQLRLPT